MPVTAVVGAQWGDEGKGRIVDFLAQGAELVVRFQGGDNAGHTVINRFGTFKLHLVPSGIFSSQTTCVIGAGAVVNPDTLLRELGEIEATGVSTDNLRVEERAHLIMPYHPALDAAEEGAGAGLGTTRRGIGPTYADKAARLGVRVGDLLRRDYLRERVAPVLERRNQRLAQLGAPTLALDEIMDQAATWAQALGHRITDTLPLVHRAVRERRDILLEGQLGVMRDLDWGIYPYVTSSNPLAGGACAGAGLPPTAITDTLGVVKCYSTAVGAGPFPVELHGERGERLRAIGQEYGATTGRPRRCGWFDGVALRYAAMISGFTGIAITKLDVLDEFDELPVCVAYRLGDRVFDTVPSGPILAQVEPIYELWPGWRSSTRGVRRWQDLPERARAYLKRIAGFADAPIRFVSVGAEREELIQVAPGEVGA